MDKQKIFLIVKIVVVVALVGVAWFRAFDTADIEKRPAENYDERMWTGVSITAYQMKFKGYERQNYQDDVQWFFAYTEKYGPQVQQQLGSGPKPMFDVDPDRMDFKEKQWFDFGMWTFGWKAPNVGKYIMGFWVNTFSKEEVDPEGYLYFNDAKGKRDCSASQAMIGLARVPNAIMSIGTVLIVMLLGWRYMHYSVGVIAGLFLVANQSYFDVTTMVGLDSAAIFFSILTVSMAIVYVEKFYKKAGAKWLIPLSIVIGICFALAVGSKLNAALVGYAAIVVFALVFLSLFRGKSKKPAEKKAKKGKAQSSIGKSELVQSLIKVGYSAAIISIITYGLFLNLNPYLKTDTVEKVKLLRTSVDEFFTIRAQSKQTTNIKDSWMESFALVANRNFVNSHDLYIENRGKHRYYGTMGSLIDFKYNFLDGLFIFIGLFALGWLGFRCYLKKNKVSGALIFAIFSLILIWGNIDFIWIDYGRYHITMYAAFSILFGTGVFYLVTLIAKKVKPDWDLKLKIDE